MGQDRSALVAPLTAMALAAVLAVLATMPTPLMVAALLVVVVMFAAGWPTLLGLPTQRGSTTILALCGTTAVIVVALTIGAGDDLMRASGTDGDPEVSRSAHQQLRWLTPVIALSVVIAFTHQLLRRDFRPRLVESVTGVVTGVVLVSVTSGWLASRVAVNGDALIHTAATAVIAGMLATVLPLARRITSPLAVAGSLAFGTAVGAWYDGLPTWPAFATSAIIAMIVVSFDRLFQTLPSARSRAAAIAHGSGVVCAAGAATYLTAGLLEPIAMLR